MPPIFVGRFAPSEAELEVYERLNNIRNRVTNRRQFELFEQRAQRLLTKKKRILKVHALITSVKARIHKLEEPEDTQASIIDYHGKCVLIIKESKFELDALKDRSADKIALDNQKEEEAIRLDQRDVDKRASQIGAGNLVASSTRQIQVFRMDTPGQAPYELPSMLAKDYTNYFEIVWFLVDKKIVDVPEVWIRREKVHKLTPLGRHWEYAHGRSKIEGDTLQLDVVDVAERNDYIVALVHENHQDIPVAIDIIKYGQGSCNLQQHLQKIWKTRSVLRACLISDPTDNKVLATSLDTSLWNPRTNDLCLYCETKDP